VAFSVPEQYLQQLKQLNGAHPLEVHALAQGDAGDETGHLSFINNAIDTTTGTIQLMATFENTAERLWPGEYVNTKVTLGIQTGAVVVPSSAVQTGQDNQFVYVVTPQSTVENHTVKTSTTVNGITVITEGVAAGDTVVVDGQLALFPGAKVAIKPPVGVGGTNGAIEAEK
jgi:multidrug efflux system membrane fusion protein